jgi:hypothetical protein
MMPRFGLRELFLSTTLIAAGVGTSCFLASADLHNAVITIPISLGAIGLGISVLFENKGDKLAIGILTAVMVLLLLFLLSARMT